MSFQLVYFCRISWNLWGSINTAKKCEVLDILIILICFSEDYERKLDLIACQRTEEKVFKLNLTGSKMTSDRSETNPLQFSK